MRPYSPQTLALRWGCSPAHVRRLINSGVLPAFRLGILIRIRPQDVEDYECQGSRGLSVTEESGPSATPTMDAGSVGRLARIAGTKPRPSLVSG